ncbi:MAG: hypothetical protein FWF29_02540, partial [Treponema sp.]|nr:hypothetical protein [Treponema sp.]
DISKTLKNIIEGISLTSKQSDDTDKCISDMSREISSFAEVITDIIDTFNKVSEDSNEIVMSLGNLREQTTAFKTGYSQMVEVNEKLVSTMNEFAAHRGSSGH